MKRSVWWLLAGVAGFIAISVGVRTCSPTGSWWENTAEDSEQVDPRLTLRNVTLEQRDESGNLLWKVDADEVTYSANQEVANLVNPEGELYQDGELLYRVRGDQGIIRENGKLLFLEDNIVATGIQNEMVINAQSLEWQPDNKLMIIRNGLTGSHPQVRAQADEAYIYDGEKRMEFLGNVIATTVTENPDTEPWVKLQSDMLQWRWLEETLETERPIKVERLANGKVTQVLTGQRSLVELDEERATIEGDVQGQLLDVPLNLTADKAMWEVGEEIIRAEDSVRVVNPEEQITVTAQRGQFVLAEEVAVFNQDVVAIAARNNGRLATDRLRWNLADQTVLAEGNVAYQQSNPQLTIRGARAQGRIEEQTVVVDGGDRVVTEIVPNF
ncbi:LPS export ABC transporter periplasmic protein LptC [Leptolyngbya iicbica]|uniref:LPS export ABC transporter periplasmic protein LptC n=2 Tax=Cyanophyceae TaxID=3028117 RepID=A0A4Q7EA45_9CYAN|nr:LPS export ABC transporter periplasmic protein LptC [Leptolyngbya sp. LK]RZM79329.1 LPS export ABC transporter periplasmic protein LptC [Leptolyngbya sp. LK]